jgi:hypothetical protein
MKKLAALVSILVCLSMLAACATPHPLKRSSRR